MVTLMTEVTVTVTTGDMDTVTGAVAVRSCRYTVRTGLLLADIDLIT